MESRGARVQAALQEAALLRRHGSFAEAERRCRAALKLHPDHLGGLFLIASILASQGKQKDALQFLRRAAAMNPVEGEALAALGDAFVSAGRPDEAIDCYRKAVALQPEDADLHYNLGISLQQSGRHAEAIDRFLGALARRPDDGAALLNVGVSQQGLGQHEAALESYAKALAAQPDLAEAHNNTGNALQSLGRHKDAIAHYEKAIIARPAYGVAHNNLGNALRALGEHAKALASYRRAVAVDAKDADAHHAVGITQLSLGEYAEGWAEYEWRDRRPAAVRRELRAERWSGKEDLTGKSILLHAEQGLGDTIQLARYVALVAAKGANVLIEVQAPLVPLLQGLPGVSRVLAQSDAPPRTDYHCPLGSLPLAFGTTLQSIPAVSPYLSVAEQAALEWRKRLAPDGARLVGLAWRGSPRYENDPDRSLPLSALAPLLKVPGLRFVSLQKELNADEAAIAGAHPALTHPGADFAATCRAVAALDLVIAVDTVWNHWAGAIGKPSWVLLNFAPHWPWLLNREDSPWYPTARLFRQPAYGDWDGAIAKAREALEAFAGGKSQG